MFLLIKKKGNRISKHNGISKVWWQLWRKSQADTASSAHSRRVLRWWGAAVPPTEWTWGATVRLHQAFQHFQDHLHYCLTTVTIKKGWRAENWGSAGLAIPATWLSSWRRSWDVKSTLMLLQHDLRVVFSGSKLTAQSWVSLDNAPHISLVCRLRGPLGHRYQRRPWAGVSRSECRSHWSSQQTFPHLWACWD